MKYQVPQFTEIEDQIIGPLTIKQFVYLAGGGGMVFVIYTYLPIYISVILIATVGGLALALAFYKVNNKPFIDFLESAFLYYTKQNLYIWKREVKKVTKDEAKAMQAKKQVFLPHLSDSKLKELSWSLDINENLNSLKEEKEKTK